MTEGVEPWYWMYETGGLLPAAVSAYLHGGRMRADHVVLLRAYLRQWIMASVWVGRGVEELRAGVDGLVDRMAISDWLSRALDLGIDPL